MNQRTYLGTTLLDVAKGAVETFMKVNKFASYMLALQFNLATEWQEIRSLIDVVDKIERPELSMGPLHAADFRRSAGQCQS